MERFIFARMRAGRPMRRRPTISLLILAIAGAIGGASPARAAEPSAADKETSRALYDEGTKALAAGDFGSAERACRGAYRLVNAPSGAVCLGQALEGEGKLVEARDAYLDAAHYPSKPDEPAIFAAARQQGRAGADRLEARIATLVLNVSGVKESAPLRVAIDGEEIPSDTARLPRKVNPGRHVVLVASQGFTKVRVEVTVGDGEEQGVDVRLVKPKAPAWLSNVPALTAFGVGAVGLVVGAVSLGDAVNQRSQCAPDGCQSQQSDNLKRDWTIFGIGFAAAAVGAGVGSYLLIASSAGSSSTSTSSRVVPWISVGALGVVGRFQ